MDTKIAAALNSINLNSQQKKVLNEVLDNKFKYINANSINVEWENSLNEKFKISHNYYDENYPGILFKGDYNDNLSQFELYFNYPNGFNIISENICYEDENKEVITEKHITNITSYPADKYFEFISLQNNIEYNNNINLKDTGIYISISTQEFINQNTGINLSNSTFELTDKYITYETSYKNNNIRETIDFYIGNEFRSKYTNLNEKKEYNLTIKYDYIQITTKTNTSLIANTLPLDIDYKGIIFSDQSIIAGSNFLFTSLNNGNNNNPHYTMMFTFLYNEDKTLIIGTDITGDNLLVTANIIAFDFVINKDGITGGISLKDTIQDIYDKINNSNDNGSDITQSFIDREIEDLIYEIAETRSKANEYDEIGDTYRELVISEKEYNKYNYTYDNTVINELGSAYHKIVVYKDILTKTITVTNSNGQQEEINVLIVE